MYNIMIDIVGENKIGDIGFLGVGLMPSGVRKLLIGMLSIMAF